MSKKRVDVLTTGGTIMARTRSMAKGAEILTYKETFPGIEVQGVDYEIRELMVKASFDMDPGDWVRIAEAVYESIRGGVDGVVILHGTDTMQYTASALSFMVQDPGVPVVLTGAMVPGGDPGSDGPGNIRAAIRAAAYADLGEVCVLFSRDEAGTSKVILRGTRAKKIHSYAINAFASINAEPLGIMEGEEISLSDSRVRRGGEGPKLKTGLNPSAFLLKMTPVISAGVLRRIISGFDGVVIEGTGLGHIKTDDEFIGVVESYGRPVVVTTQCLYGGERLGVYTLDKKILAIGNVIPSGDMLPETALVKLMWSMGQGGDVRGTFLRSVAGEISSS